MRDSKESFHLVGSRQDICTRYESWSHCSEKEEESEEIENSAKPRHSILWKQ